MNLPILENIGGSLNASGTRGLNLPKLRSVGGDFVVDGTGLEHLPPLLEHIGGNALISRADPTTLLNDLVAAKKSGVLKGDIFVDGGLYDASATRPFLKKW